MQHFKPSPRSAFISLETFVLLLVRSWHCTLVGRVLCLVISLGVIVSSWCSALVRGVLLGLEAMKPYRFVV